MPACVLSRFCHVRLFVTLWTIAHQVPLSLAFSRQEYWSGLQCLPPGDLPNPGIKPTSLISSTFDKWVLYHQCHLGNPYGGITNSKTKTLLRYLNTGPIISCEVAIRWSKHMIMYIFQIAINMKFPSEKFSWTLGNMLKSFPKKQKSYFRKFGAAL